jgi:hypothetical protein
MTVVWEDPPTVTRSGRGKVKSPLRLEVDEMMNALREHPGKWARLYDFEEKEQATKRHQFMQRKGYGFATRQTADGWSLYGRFKGDDPSEAETRRPTFE